MEDSIKEKNIEMLQMFEGLTPPDIQDIQNPHDFWEYREAAEYQLKALEAQAEHIAFKVQFTKALISHFGRCIYGTKSEKNKR